MIEDEPKALLIKSGDPKYMPVVALNVRYHCRETRAKDKRCFDLINGTYMNAAIVVNRVIRKLSQNYWPRLPTDRVIASQATE